MSVRLWTRGHAFTPDNVIVALGSEIGDAELCTNNPSPPGANPILPPYVPTGTYNNLEIRAGIVWRVW